MFEKVKEDVRWSLFIAWSAKSWSLGFKRMTCVNMHDALALCVEFPLVACVSRITTIKSHASYLIKTPPPMHLIT